MLMCQYLTISMLNKYTVVFSAPRLTLAGSFWVRWSTHHIDSHDRRHCEQECWNESMNDLQASAAAAERHGRRTPLPGAGTVTER